MIIILLYACMKFFLVAWNIFNLENVRRYYDDNLHSNDTDNP